MSLTVDTEIPAGVNLLGKTIAELQSDIVVGNDTISGTLHPIVNFTGFSNDVSEQEGYFLALHIDANTDDATITVELVGGTHRPVELDSDRTIILRITDTTTQSIRITATADGYSDFTKTYSLTGIALEETAM